ERERADGEDRFLLVAGPVRGLSPAEPDRTLIGVLAAACGTAAGGLLLLVGEWTDPTIRKRRDLEMFGKPVIVDFP
ncbi:MAG: hypothetical protein WB626_11260, partial [Bacteroidota bacterium]